MYKRRGRTDRVVAPAPGWMTTRLVNMRQITALLTVLVIGAMFARIAHSQTTTPPPTTAAEAQILYHEGVTFSTSRTAVATGFGGKERWEFAAFGRDFVLELESNNRLLSKMSAAQREELNAGADGSVRLLRGQLLDVPTSWVRLTESPQGVSALIFDGNELLAIEPTAAVAESLSIPELNADTVAYALSEVYMSPQMCATEAAPIAGGSNAAGQLEAVVGDLQSQTAATQALDMAVYVQNWSGDLLSRLNAVDGIFTQELGISLNIVSVTTGNYVTFGSGTELRDFRTAVTPINGFTTANHLFTNNDRNVGWAGIAYIRSLCGGAGISKMIGNLASEVTLISHELGHNFGAPHDGQSGACANVPNQFIMWPVVNRTTSFSDCSISTMQSTIEFSQGRCLADATNAPTTTLSISDLSVEESVGTASIQVSLSAPRAVSVDVTVSTGTGSATSGEDYIGRSERLTIPAGATGGVFDVQVIDDNDVEEDEVVEIRLSNPVNVQIATASANLRILDNDIVASTPQLSIREVTVNELDPTINVPVELSEPSLEPVVVTAFTQSGQAETGEDFFGLSRRLTFAPGVTRQFFTIPIVDDLLVEDVETFVTRLIDPSGATLDEARSSVRIIDNDSGAGALSVLTITPTSVPESTGVVSVRLALTRAVPRVVSATVFTRSDTAMEGQDFFGITREIQFQPGEEVKSFDVIVLDDDTVENKEGFTVRANNIQGLNPISLPAVISIEDND